MFFLLGFQEMKAQDYTIDVQNIGVKEGLLHRRVSTIFEDRNGFIWVGNNKGLQRFDGQEFKTWTKANRTGLIYYISSIGQDDEGWLWLWNGDLDQFVFLNPDTEEIQTAEERFGKDYPIFKESRLTEMWSKSSRLIPTNSKGQLCFGAIDGKIIFYDSKNGFQTRTLKTKTRILAHIELIDNDDNIWIQPYNVNGLVTEYIALYKMDTLGNQLSSFHIPKNKFYSNFTLLDDVIYFDERSFNTTTTNKDKSVKFLKIEKGNLQSVFPNEDHFINTWILNNHIWKLSNKQGWNIFENESQIQPVFTLSKNDYHPSLFEKSNKYFVDSKRKIWIYGRLGLNKIDFSKNKFKKIFSFPNENERPFYSTTRGIWAEGDTIMANFEFSHSAKFHKETMEGWTIPEDGEPRPILKNRNGNFFIGYPFYVSEINSKGEKINEFRPKKGEVFSGTWSLIEDQNERLWIGSGDKLLFKNKLEDSIQIFKSTEDPFGFTTRRGAIQNMISTEDGKIWLCSWTGLYLFDPIQEKILARYASSEKGQYFLPADIFYYLHKDLEGIYWIGTGDGLIRWEGPSTQNSSDSNYKLFTRNAGLTNDVIYAIFEDEYNHLWMSSDYGIMSFDKETYDVNAYLEKDGITHHEFNRTAQFKDKEGNIYFGGLNGITAFHPDDFITLEKDYSKMRINDFEIFEGEKQALVNKVRNLRTTNTINFYPKDRFFRLKFSLLSFDDKSKILYAWKIDGVDNNWNYQKENSLQIGVLPYGTHTLRIKGQSASGGWSPHELAIEVNVLKPFYLQTWFLILSLFALLASIFAFSQWRTYQYKIREKQLKQEVEKATEKISKDKETIQKQAEKLKHLDKVKSRFFANVSHELRTPLTLMLGPISSVLKNKENSNKDFTLLKMAQQNGKDLLKLISSILDLSKMEAGKLELHEESELLFPLVRRIVSNFESHAQRANIRFIFDYKILKELQFEIDKSKLEIIFNNLLSNAMKFTQGGGRVTFKAIDLENTLQFSVTDTGRGVHPDDLPYLFDRFYQSNQADAPTEGGTGIGLAVSQEFIKMMDGKIWIESEYGQGSTFYIQIPRKEVLGHADKTDIASIEESNIPVINGTFPSIPEVPTIVDNNKSTILIVEDNYSLRHYLETILAPHFNLLTAENGQAGLDILSEIINKKKKLPDLILSDIMMPIMDGYQLLKVLRSKDYFRSIPIVMLTARADIQDKLTALRIGVDDYLLKPFEEEELLVRINNLLKNYSIRKSIPVEVLADEVASEANIKENVVSKKDQEWLELLEKTILENIADSRFNMDFLGEKMLTSRRQLQRRIKKIVGLTPKEYINEIRLYEARQLLETGQTDSIKKTASQVGFTDSQYFSIQFKERFGKVPSEYLN